MIDESALEAAARANVLRVRGSEDAPGFEACVREEMGLLRPVVGAYLAAVEPQGVIAKAVELDFAHPLPLVTFEVPADSSWSYGDYLIVRKEA